MCLLQATLLVPTYEGVIVQTTSAVDPDLNTILTYEIASGNSARKFAIRERTGEIYVRDSNALRSVYSLRVKVRRWFSCCAV